MGVLAYLDANEPALARVDDMVWLRFLRDWNDQGQQKLEGRTRVTKAMQDVDV